LRDDGKAFFGFTFRLDATEARTMALHHAGLRSRPDYQPVLDHPWEAAFLKGESIPWQAEPAFATISWLPEDKP